MATTVRRKMGRTSKPPVSTKLARVLLVVAMALAVPVVSARVGAMGQDCTPRYQAPGADGQVAAAFRLKPSSVGRPSLTPQAVVATLLGIDIEASALSLPHAAGRPPLALVLTVAGRSPPLQSSKS
jgi:hypothetical protein